MGVLCEVVHEIPKKPEYSYTKFDSFSTDRQVKNTVKLVPRILNIDSKYSCQIKLIIFTNDAKTAFKQGGKTDDGKVDPENNIMNFKKFFIMDYLFEKSSRLNL